MKKIIYFFAFLLTFTCYAQTFQEYFVVEKENHSIEPSSKVLNNDGTLTLAFEHQDINDLFNNKGGVIVNKYEKAFPGAVSPLLQRTYIVSLNSNQYLNDLENLSDVDFVELIEEPTLLFEPDDPYYVDGGIGFSYLELVRANKAWDITTGDPDIIIGISDSGFDINHEDLKGKFVYADNVVTFSTHGTWVAGMVSPNTNNGKGISGIGYDTRMIGTSMGLTKVFQLAQNPDVKAINLSWGGRCNDPSPIENEMYTEIREEFNVLIIAAAGNGKVTCPNPTDYVYPASYDKVMSVSSVGHISPIGDSLMENQKDVHQRFIDLANPEDNTHQHNDKVDIVAPGFDFRTTDYGSNYKYIHHGTSSAAPQVAAAAGLIYSINPNLSADDVEDILKRTADDIYWIPENAPYIGKLGTGRLNVFRAVKETECMNDSNPVVDLVVRDSKEDIGIEPNGQTTGVFWKSDDIWVRSQPDGKYYYETDEVVNYSLYGISYVYVRVTNYGCETSSGDDELVLSWAASTTSHPLPENSTSSTNGFVGTKTIPPLAPGQEAIIEFEWHTPNPDNFPPVFMSTVGLNASLLARIISDDDPISYPSSSNIIDFVKNNNNVAWKNINIINVAPDVPYQGTKFFVYNPTDQVQTYDIELNEAVGSANKSLYKEAEIYLEMDTNIYNSWSSGGNMADNLNATRSNERKLISGESSALENITLQPGEIGGIEISFNFLTKEMTGTELYEYDIIQKNVSSGEVVGGTTILIDKYNRTPFVADVQKEEENNQVKLTAEDIGESAVYNWYDSEGNLIYSGREITVSPEFAKTYNLEIISNLDGFKDYKEVSVDGIVPYSLNSLSPNPAGNQVQVSYEIPDASSAYLIITNTLTNASNNYILDLGTSQKSIDLSGYSSGVYLVTLVCDGIVVDSKNLLKN